MQAIRRLPLSVRSVGLRTAHTVSSTPSTSSIPKESIIPLSNIEAQWATLDREEQVLVHRQLEELQKKDWKGLSLDEKKAAYYVSFGPHGPRTPATAPGSNFTVFLGVVGILATSGVVFELIRSRGSEPKTMTKEWQEASNEKALEQKQNPITGIASEGYKGKGHVQSK